MGGKRILMILGGIYHDFEGFARAVSPLLKARGHNVTPTYDLDLLTHLDQGDYDLVLSYASLSKHREGKGDTTPETLSPAQTEALTTWVRAGHGLLGVHSATVSGQPNAAMRELFGARFESHPKEYSFAVYPMARPHPITHDIEAFCVKDEFYLQDAIAGLDVHMVAVDRGVAHPMVWTKTEGQGRVACVGMGHSALVWDLPQYRQLLLQAVDWLTAE